MTAFRPLFPASLVLALASLGSARAADDWTRLLGPGGHGVATVSRPLLAPNEWRIERVIELGATGHSSPVTFGGTVFVTGAREGRHSVLEAFSLADGQLLFTAELGRHDTVQHQLNSDASATPVVDADGIVVSYSLGGELWLAALGLDGEPQWRRSLGSFSAQHGSGASPILVGDVVLIGKDHEAEGSALYGVERHSGEVRWKRERETSRASYATPILIPGPNGDAVAVFASTSHGLTALDPASGALVFEVPLGFTERCVGGTAATDGFLWQNAGSGGGGRESAIVELAAEGGPVVRHRPGRALPYVTTPIGVGGRFFACSDGGIYSCLDARTGEALWQERIENASFFGSPILVGDVLVGVSKEGEMVSVRAAAHFELLDRRSLGEASFATPAVTDGQLLVRTLGHLHVFDLCGAAESRPSKGD